MTAPRWLQRASAAEAERARRRAVGMPDDDPRTVDDFVAAPPPDGPGSVPWDELQHRHRRGHLRRWWWLLGGPQLAYWIRPYDQFTETERRWRWQKPSHCGGYLALSPEKGEALWRAAIEHARKDHA